MNKTYSPKPSEIDRQWYIVDATGQTLGRLSTQIARVLTGKNKPQYAPHIDTGDFVVVINAEKTVLTGRKDDQKIYDYNYQATKEAIQRALTDRAHRPRPEPRTRAR